MKKPAKLMPKKKKAPLPVARKVTGKKRVRVCKGCNNFMGVQCDGGWNCPGAY